MEEISTQQLKKLIKDISDLGSSVQDIKDYLLGTEYNRKGLVERVEDLEKDMFNLNVIKWKMMGAAATVGTIASVAVSVVLKLMFNV